MTVKSSLGWLVCPVVLDHLGGLWLLRCGKFPTRLWWVCCLTTANVASGGWWLGFTPPQSPLGADSDPKPQEKEALLAAQPISRLRAPFAPAGSRTPDLPAWRTDLTMLIQSFSYLQAEPSLTVFIMRIGTIFKCFPVRSSPCPVSLGKPTPLPEKVLPLIYPKSCTMNPEFTPHILPLVGLENSSLPLSAELPIEPST